MTFFREFSLALLLLALIFFGIYFYYSCSEPLFFYESVGWALDPKAEDLVFIEKVTWVNINHAKKIKDYFPEIATPPDKEAFLFILQKNNPKTNNSTQSIAVNGETTASKTKGTHSLYDCTLVNKDGPVMNWKSENPNLEKIYKLGAHRELKQPVAGIIVQLFTQKPWKNFKIPTWNQIKEQVGNLRNEPKTAP